MIRLVDSTLIIETRTTRATFAGIRLVSIQDAASGEEFLESGIGYHYGDGANRRPMIDATLKQGAIPTLIFRTADPLQELQGEEAQYILERALS